MDVQKALSDLFSLAGKTVLITGAAGSIGSRISTGLAAVGARMALCDINLKGLDAVKAGIEDTGGVAEAFEMDMLDLASIRNCVDEVVQCFGSVDVLINMAGINKRVYFADGDEETFDRIMGVNLKGAHFLSQAVVRNMKQQQSGSIINIGSYNAVMMLGGCGVYGESKSAVLAMTRVQAIELAPYGIRSNVVCPGHISTELTAPLWNDPVKSRYLLDRIAMNRPGKPEDLLGTIILLASDASSYISGSVFHVDGGCLAGGQPWEL